MHAHNMQAEALLASYEGSKSICRKVHHLGYVHCMQNHVSPRHDGLPVEAEARGRVLRCWTVYERICKLSSFCKDIMLLGFCWECWGHTLRSVTLTCMVYGPTSV